MKSPVKGGGRALSKLGRISDAPDISVAAGSAVMVDDA